MERKEERPIRTSDQQIRLLEYCLRLSQRRTEALIDHDLAVLEEVAAEQALAAELLALGTPPPDENIGDGAALESRRILRRLSREIRATNRKNLALIANGMDFTRTMLDTICPPVTYEPLGRASTPVSRIPPESRISIKG